MGPKKEKRILTDEEKAIKAQMQALKAEEDRKKKEQERIDRMQELQAHEDKICTANMRKIQTHWRTILRNVKVQELRTEIQWLSEEHERQVARKDNMIKTLRSDLRESAGQHSLRYENHVKSVDGIIDLHHHRLKVMEDQFQDMLRLMQREFTTEKDSIDATFARNKKEMTSMLRAMKEEFHELKQEVQHQFDADREEVKNKDAEAYNIMKLSLEGQIMDLENQIETAHQQYLASTEAKTVAYKQLSVKDAVTSRSIEKRMKKLVHLHELLAMWRAKIATNSKEWEATNKALRGEKDNINKHYQELKRNLVRTHNVEHEKLKTYHLESWAISVASGDAVSALKKKYEMVERLIKLGMLNSKLETECEKICPFDPLHCSTFPTQPVAEYDAENGEDEESDMLEPNRRLSFFEETAVGADKDKSTTWPEPAPESEPRSWSLPDMEHMANLSKRGSRATLTGTEALPQLPEDRAVVPRLDHLATMSSGGSRSSLPGLDQLLPEKEGSNIRLASYAVDEDGEEVAEWDYMNRFNKRFNKVQLDALTIEESKARLLEEHNKLKQAVEIYLNGLSLNDKTLSGAPNTLLIVKRLLQRAEPEIPA